MLQVNNCLQVKSGTSNTRKVYVNPALPRCNPGVLITVKQPNSRGSWAKESGRNKLYWLANLCDVLLLNKLLLVVVDVLQLHTPLRTYSYDWELIILRTYSLKKSEHRYCCHTHTTYESNSTDLYFEHSVVFLKL